MEFNNYVYILECSDKTLYIGYTNNLEKRIFVHNNKKGAKYTRGRTPVILKYYECFENKIYAMQQEYKLKNLSREQKIKYIKNNITENKIKLINKINNKE